MLKIRRDLRINDYHKEELKLFQAQKGSKKKQSINAHIMT